MPTIALFLVSLLALLSAGIATAAEPSTNRLDAAPQFADVARRFSRSMPSEHLLRWPVDDRVAARAWTNLLSALDYEHLFFLASDVETFQLRKTRLDDEVNQGRLDFAYTVYAKFRDRVRDRVAYVDELLGKGFDVDVDESYAWKRRKSPWPRDIDEQNDLWRRKIKNEYIQQIISRESADKPAATNGTPQAQLPLGATNDSFRLPAAENMEIPTPVVTNGAVAVTATNRVAAPPPTPEEFIRKRYQQYLTTLQDNDAEWVLQEYLSAFAAAYDPHSSFMTESSSEDFDIEMKLSLVGIGALLRSEEGMVKVVRVIPGGPADKDTRAIKLQAGDKIVAVAQEREAPVDVLHWPLPKVVRLIRGKKGTRVLLSVIPASDPSGSKTRIVDLVRDEVKLEEQAAKSSVREVTTPDGRKRRLGVINVPAFYANLQARSALAEDYKRVSADVQVLIGNFRTNSIDGLLLDLRGNGGGALLEAINLTGLFISAGPVVQVQELDRLKILPDMDPAVTYEGPLVVLVNRLSASASEIFAAALQDYGRAIIVGDSRTHGKGTVQTIIPLGKDRSLGSIKVTCSMFFRITGETTQKRGVVPDIVIPDALDYMEIGEDALPNAMEPFLIRPALFQPVSAPVGRWTPMLRQNSTKRRAEDPRYAAYLKLLDQMRQIQEAEVISLNIEQRRELARQERSLEKLQREMADEDDAEQKKDNGKRPDLVLDEALNILGDMVLTGEKESAQGAADGEPRNTPRPLVDWLRSTP